MRSRLCMFLSLAVTPAAGFGANASIIASAMPAEWNPMAKAIAACAMSAPATFFEMWVYMVYCLNAYGE